MRERPEVHDVYEHWQWKRASTTRSRWLMGETYVALPKLFAYAEHLDLVAELRRSRRAQAASRMCLHGVGHGMWLLARRVPQLADPLRRSAASCSPPPRSWPAKPRRWGRAGCPWCIRRSTCTASVGRPAEPPHILYAGRLSEEKGVLELVEATAAWRG